MGALCRSQEWVREHVGMGKLRWEVGNLHQQYKGGF
jgi:hypothetical protein